MEKKEYTVRRYKFASIIALHLFFWDYDCSTFLRDGSTKFGNGTWRSTYMRTRIMKKSKRKPITQRNL